MLVHVRRLYVFYNVPLLFELGNISDPVLAEGLRHVLYVLEIY